MSVPLPLSVPLRLLPLFTNPFSFSLSFSLRLSFFTFAFVSTTTLYPSSKSSPSVLVTRYHHHPRLTTPQHLSPGAPLLELREEIQSNHGNGCGGGSLLHITLCVWQASTFPSLSILSSLSPSVSFLHSCYTSIAMCPHSVSQTWEYEGNLDQLLPNSTTFFSAPENKCCVFQLNYLRFSVPAE